MQVHTKNKSLRQFKKPVVEMDKKVIFHLLLIKKLC